MLSDGYNAEQKTTVERLKQLKTEIEQLKSTAIYGYTGADTRDPADIHQQNRDSRAPVTKEKRG